MADPCAPAPQPWHDVPLPKQVEVGRGPRTCVISPPWRMTSQGCALGLDALSMFQNSAPSGMVSHLPAPRAGFYLPWSCKGNLWAVPTRQPDSPLHPLTLHYAHWLPIADMKTYAGSSHSFQSRLLPHLLRISFPFQSVPPSPSSHPLQQPVPPG